jgi:hypothetical protein
VSEYINSDSGSVTLEPDGKIGFAFEVGLSYNNLTFSFFGKECQFDKYDQKMDFISQIKMKGVWVFRQV